MSRLIHIYLWTLIFQLSLSQIPTNPCNDNEARCLKCEGIKGKPNICTDCLFQKTFNETSCKDKPSIENCMEQIYGQDTCETCLFGYVPSEDFRSCQKTTIQNCMVASRVKDGAGTRVVCSFCFPGFASSIDGLKCDDAPEDSKKIPNCQLYSTNANGTYRCTSCTLYFAVDSENKCTGRCGAGCHHCKNDKCQDCNVLYGYFMSQPNKCVKQGLPDGVNPFYFSSNLITLSGVLISLIIALLI